MEKREKKIVGVVSLAESMREQFPDATKAQRTEFVKAVFRALAGGIKRDGEVIINNFGRLIVAKKRKCKINAPKNPNATLTVRFRPAPWLKESINNVIGDSGVENDTECS